MATDFIILCEGELNFLQTSLKQMLEAKNIGVDRNFFSVKALGKLEEFPRGFIVDAELLNGVSEVRTYLYDLCIEKQLRIIIMGDSYEVDKALDTMSPRIVGGAFKRPINNQEMTDKIIALWEQLIFEDRKRKILVVDDSPVFLRTVSEWLGSDYAVSICPSATAAFHMIEVNRPELILLDYEMPVCSGAQFLEMLHSEPSSADIPVIFLTSRSDKETVTEVIALKPQGYLLKTRPKEEILNTISEFFEKEKGR